MSVELNEDEFCRRRRRLLIEELLSFVVWQIGSVAINRYSLEGAAVLVGTAASVFGSLWFAVVMYRLYRLQKQLAKNPKLMARLGDERSKVIANESIRLGFFITLGVVALAVAITSFVDVRGSIIAITILVAAVTSVIGVAIVKEGR